MPHQQGPKRPEIVITDAPDVFRTYANHINVTWNVFDVRLHFGDSDVLTDSQGKVNVKTKTMVTMSWTGAKQVADILAQVIRRFEEVNGPIKKVEEIKIG